MEWFEPLIILGAFSLVALPFILNFYHKKKGKLKCGHDCSCCSSQCVQRLKKSIEDYKKAQE